MGALKNNHIIKTKFPHLDDILQGRSSQAKAIEIEPIHTGNNSNLHIRYGNREATIHNEESPWQEAHDLFLQLKDASIDHMMFFGMGMGHHILQFQRQFPHIPFSIYEPSVEVFQQFAKHAVLDEWNMDQWRNLFVGSTDQELVEQLKGFVDRTPGTISSCSLPAYMHIFERDNQKFDDLLAHTLESKQGNLHISNKFSVYWLSNSLRNFKHVLSTPSILQQKEYFRNKPVIIVAAGPSLNEEIGNLKEIKKERSAYIFAVGSALSTLINHDIYPDAICSYDPSPRNGIVFKQVIEKRIKEIPLIFGSSIGGIDLGNYPGPKWHMVTSQDTIAAYFLPTEKTGIPVVHDASSIAIITLQFLCMIGAGPIILVGQNFAYKGVFRYAQNIDHIDPVKNFKGAPVVKTRSVQGDMVDSNSAFLSMKKEMEMYIESFHKKDVFNTTQGGADIKGTTFMSLKEVRSRYLKPNTVDTDWLLYSGVNLHIAGFGLADQVALLQTEHHKLTKSFEEFQHIFKDMHFYVIHEQREHLQQLFIIFDRAFDRWLNNLYSKLLLIPASRAQYEFLYSQVENVLKERDPLRKASLIMQYYSRFLAYAYQVDQQIRPMYLELLEALHV